MDSEEETRIYTELTPVMLETSQGYRTEVKVPVTPRGIESIECTNVDTTGADSYDTFTAVATCNISQSDYSMYVSNSVGAPDEVYVKTESQNEDDYNDNIVYNGLVALYRGLPKEMFINRILLNEASCENKLGEMRSSLFEHLKETDDFPYGLQCQLKRRVCTRNSDSVAVKLSQDIHTFMSVLEGAEYSDMRELLSSGSGRSQRSQSSPNDTTITYDSSSEIKILSDSVNTLKAEVLHLKQTQTALETARSKEIQSMKTTILGLKSDITTFTNLTQTSLNKIALSTERIESEKCLGITQLKNELKVMRINIRDMKDSIDTLQIQGPANGAAKTRRRKSGGKTRSGKHTVDTTGLSSRLSSSVSGGVDQEPVDVQEVLNITISENNENDCEINGSNLDLRQTEDQQGQVVSSLRAENSLELTNTNTIPCRPRGETHVENIYGTPNVSLNGRADTTSNYNNSALSVNADCRVESIEVDNECLESGAERTYRDVTGSSSAHNIQPQNFSSFRYNEATRNSNQEHSDGTLSGRPIDTRVTRPYVRAKIINEPSENPITEHINGSSRGRDDDSDHNDEDDDDFEQYVKKRAKRFYLGGFLPSVTRQVIAKYIKKRARGIKVTWIRIWKSRRNPNSVVIRLNVEDNDQAKLLERRSFWPRGVTCRPWRDNNERDDRYSRRAHTLDYRGDSMHPIYGRSDIDDYNPYSPLRSHVNMD